VKKIKNIKSIFLLSFFVALFSLLFLSYLYFQISLKEQGERENFNTKKISNFMNEIAKKYNKEIFYNLTLWKVVTNNITLNLLEKECNSLKTKKEKLLCIAEIRILKRQIELFSKYLPYALVIYEKKDPECFIEEGLVDRSLMAQLLHNYSLCEGDKKCIELLEKEYDFSSALININRSYNLYKKGFLELKSKCLN